MCRALKEAGILMPDWDKIGKELGISAQPISASTFFESWYDYAQNCQPTWNQLAQALESSGSSKDKRAAVEVRAKEGMFEHIKECGYVCTTGVVICYIIVAIQLQTFLTCVQQLAWCFMFHLKVRR